MNPLITSTRPRIHQAARRSSAIARRATSSMPSKNHTSASRLAHQATHQSSAIPRRATSSMPVNAHTSTLSLERAGGSCPYLHKEHEYRPPQVGDLRSPCPALNTLANHGYLPRDGKNIGVRDLVRALKEGYNLSTVLANILSIGGALILAQWRSMSLADLARHNVIEHDASLVHKDDVNGDEYASTKVDKTLLRHVFAESGKVIPGRMTLEDAARIRVKRESECRKLDGVHAEIARGEIAIAIGVLGGKDAAKTGVDVGVLHDWMQNERLPADWKPDHTQGLYQTYKMATFMRERMAELKAEQSPEATVGSQ